MTAVRDALDSALVALNAAGVETPRLDAELLLADALGVDRTALYLDRDLRVAGPAVRRFQDLVRLRAVERMPVAYLLGRKGFRRLELEIDPRVLVPRPETELLVEVALALPSGASVLDVGTGSGAVALALADERPDLRVTGSDVSADALAVARANGRRLGLDVAWVEHDALPPGDWDAVVANLPYVAEGERLAPEITRHEPSGALFAGPDGLDAIRALVARAGAARIPFLALEHGADQGAAVRGLLAGAGYGDVRTERDLAGHERVSVGC